MLFSAKCHILSNKPYEFSRTSKTPDLLLTTVSSGLFINFRRVLPSHRIYKNNGK